MYKQSALMYKCSYSRYKLQIGLSRSSYIYSRWWCVVHSQSDHSVDPLQLGVVSAIFLYSKAAVTVWGIAIALPISILAAFPCLKTI